jgi:hypothetical protein
VTPAASQSVVAPIPVVYLQELKIKKNIERKINSLPAFKTGNMFLVRCLSLNRVSGTWQQTLSPTEYNN